MTLAEFKAWFEGYTEGMNGPPSGPQWDRIKARIGEIGSSHTGSVDFPSSATTTTSITALFNKGRSLSNFPSYDTAVAITPSYATNIA